MEHSSLYECIKNLQYGTNLHIGIVFFDNYGNSKTALPLSHAIHSSPVCEELKNRYGGFKKCFFCRQMAIRKAITEKSDFDGFCINGIYEYTRPVFIKDKCVCVIFIGNIVNEKIETKRNIVNIIKDKKLLDTMERNFGKEKCKELGKLIESYIRFLLEKYSDTTQNSKNALIENIKYYIELNSEYDLKLSHIAEHFHYNKQYLGRLFIKNLGFTFNEYLNISRINRAKVLLEKSSMNIVDIAVDTGFNNVTYFNRIFKKQEGCTPSQYRKIIQ